MKKVLAGLAGLSACLAFAGSAIAAPVPYGRGGHPDGNKFTADKARASQAVLGSVTVNAEFQVTAWSSPYGEPVVTPYAAGVTYITWQNAPWDRGNTTLSATT